MSKPTEEPKIDGIPICEIIEIGTSPEINDPGGCYQRIGRISTSERRKRFTIFVGFGTPTVTIEHGVETFDWPGIEEIDVNAVDDTDAFIIAELALHWHYEPGGKIIAATERWGMYF